MTWLHYKTRASNALEAGEQLMQGAIVLAGQKMVFVASPLYSLNIRCRNIEHNDDLLQINYKLKTNLKCSLTIITTLFAGAIACGATLIK